MPTKKIARRPRRGLEALLEAMEEFFDTAARLAPRNAPGGSDTKKIVAELQRAMKSGIGQEIAAVRKAASISDRHTLRALDERIAGLRAVQLTRETTKLLRRKSR